MTRFLFIDGQQAFFDSAFVIKEFNLIYLGGTITTGVLGIK
jgi:hypothetical protein